MQKLIALKKSFNPGDYDFIRGDITSDEKK